MDEVLDERKRKILKAIIKTYMETGEPVGSRTISKYPDLSNRDVKLRLKERAIDLKLPKNQQGWGFLDVERLLQE